MDCVDAEGGVVIAYWTSLVWRRLSLTWHSVARYDPDGAHQTRTSVARCGPPLRSAEAIFWEAARLRCAVDLRPRQPAMATVPLHERVEWTCVAPAAAATINFPGRPPIHGTGYAEFMVMRVPPWRLGIRQLRWGRWISADASRSAAWIGWTGDPTHRWVFVDGKRAAQDEISDVAIDVGDATLVLGDRRTLHDRTLGRTLGRVPALRAVVPKAMLSLRETKWLRSGALCSRGAPPIAGTVIDEVAVFG